MKFFYSTTSICLPPSISLSLSASLSLIFALSLSVSVSAFLSLCLFPSLCLSLSLSLSLSFPHCISQQSLFLSVSRSSFLCKHKPAMADVCTLMETTLGTICFSKQFQPTKFLLSKNRRKKSNFNDRNKEKNVLIAKIW